MPTTIQGNWTIDVLTVNRSQFQRFIITGATTGNGVYSSNNTNTNSYIALVRGSSWNLTIQGQVPGSSDQWRESNIRINPTITGANGIRTFTIESDGADANGNFTDLTLLFKEIVDVVTPPPPVVVPPVVTPPVITPPTPVIPTPPVVVSPPQVIVPGKVYTKLNIDDVLPRQVNKITYGIWLDTDCEVTGNLLTYHTSSILSSSVFRPVYQLPVGDCCSERMFDISYGHKDGSGSQDLGGKDYYTLSKAVYGQYKNLCGVSEFKLGEKQVKHFYVINVKRSRMGDCLDLGVNEINLHQLSGSQWGVNQTHTGSNVKLGASGNIIRLIDDSKLDYSLLSSSSKLYYYSNINSTFTHHPDYSYIVSGTLENGVYNTTDPKVYGLIYPKLGIYLLDADVLDVSGSFLTVTGSDMNGDNPMKLFKSMSGSALYTDPSGDYLGFQSRKVKYEFIDRYFVRVKNNEYNHSNNPTWRTGSEGQIIDDFQNGNPQVYVSEIGLFNDNRELIAVGKISKPIPKNFTTEGLYTITLKYEG